MGQYWIFVNETKKASFSPHKFDEGLKFFEFGRSVKTLLALRSLLSRAWRDCRVAIVGDYALSVSGEKARENIEKPFTNVMQDDLLKTDAFAIVNDDDGSYIMINEDDLCPNRSMFTAAVVWFLLDASSLGDGDGLAADAWLQNPVLSDTAGRWAYKRLRIARPEHVTDNMRMRNFTDTVRLVMNTLDLVMFTLMPLARSSLFESRSFGDDDDDDNDNDADDTDDDDDDDDNDDTDDDDDDDDDNDVTDDDNDGTDDDNDDTDDDDDDDNDDTDDDDVSPLSSDDVSEVNANGRALTQFLLVSQKNRVSRRELLTDKAHKVFPDDDQTIVLTATFKYVEDVLGWEHMHAFQKFIVKIRWRKIAHVARFLSLLRHRVSENNFELVQSSELPEFIAQQHWKNRVGIGGFLDFAPALVTREFMDYYRANRRFSRCEGLEGGPFFHEVRDAVRSFVHENNPDTISQVLQPEFKHHFVKFRLKYMETKKFMDAPLFCDDDGKRKLSPAGERVLYATPSLFATWLKKYGRCGGHRGYFQEPPDFQHIFSKEFREFRNYGVVRTGGCDENDSVPFHSWSWADTKRALHSYLDCHNFSTVRCVLEHTNIELIDEFDVYAKQDAKIRALPKPYPGKAKKRLKT